MRVTKILHLACNPVQKAIDKRIDIPENSENLLNPIIIRLVTLWANENAPQLSFPRRRESRKISLQELGYRFCIYGIKCFY